MFIGKETYTIRGWNLDDVASLAEHINNFNIWINVRDRLPYPYTTSDAKDFIEMVLNSPEQHDFAIEIEGKAVGGVGIVPSYDVERFNAEIGYWLAEKYWNQGIMSNVVKTLSDYIFDNTQFIRLFAPVFEYNKGSMKVLENAGFTKVAVLRKAAIKNGQIIDLHYYDRLSPSQI